MRLPGLEVEMKAFLVDCEQENGAQLYFAPTRGKAKAMAANEEGINITEVSSCQRKPEYDEYSPGPVPPSVLLKDGWWIECSGCGKQVWDDCDEDDPVFSGQSVWCSAACKERDEVREASRKADFAALEKRATEATLARFPGVSVYLVTERYHRPEPYVHFHVPGDTQGIGWEVGSGFVECAPIDRAAWDAYEDRRATERALARVYRP